MSERKPRVLVAMSGGVDSSVAAALLKEQGYDVVGMIMQVWDYSDDSCDIQEGNGTCCSSTDVEDAQAVADHLDIPFYVANCESKFKERVIDDFVDNYLQGRTPIPCVHCNTHLKFDHLIQKMRELDCDYLATGHYAQVETSPTGRPGIVTSRDDWKDQTYFLFTMDPELIPKLKFPVGNWTKPQLREYAKEKGLPVATKKDSTGICFIGNKGYAGFVEEHADSGQLRPGKLRLYPGGEELGDHEGIHRFTYGQRKGLGVSSDRPLYVVKIEADDATVWLGDEEHLMSQSMEIENIHLLDEISDDETVSVKIRFHHAGAKAKVIRTSNGRAEVKFDEPQRAVTPGQAAVIYRDRQLVGGGWIC